MDHLTRHALTKLDALADYLDTIAVDLARDGMELTGADLAHIVTIARHLAIRGLTRPADLLALLEADPADVLALTQERCPGEAVS
jgi:hypothetical protein